MPSFRAFGRVLRADFPLPELDPAPPGPAHWHVVRAASPAAPSGDPCGSEPLYDDVSASLHRREDRWWITVDDTGTYEWDPGTRTISCWQAPYGSDDFLRAHLLGRVLATAMHDDGCLVLHAGAVAIGGRAVAFVGPKGAGKSTLTLALALDGAAMVADDTLPVEFGPDGGAAIVRPGIAALRLEPDQLERLGAQPISPPRDDGKLVALPPASVARARDPLPLDAVYLLTPVARIDGGLAAARAPLPAPLAVAALVGQAKVAAMLGPAEGPELLARATQLQRVARVERLLVLRDAARLAEVVEAVSRWHAPAGPLAR